MNTSTAIGIIFLILCLHLSAVVGCTQETPQAKKSQYKESGLRYFDKDQYREALIEFKNAAQIDPKDADVHYRIALVYFKIGGSSNVQAGFNELLKAVELEPSHREAQLKIGAIYLLSNNPVQAYDRAEIILSTAPRDPEALHLKAQGLLGQKEFQRSVDEFKKAIEANPKNIHAYIGLSQAHIGLKDLKSAQQTLELAASANPQSTEARMALGDLHVLLGNPNQAEQEFKKAIEIGEEQDAPYMKLVSLYYAAGRAADAEAVVKKLAAARPSDEKPLVLLADYYKAVGDQSGALATYQKAVDVKPDSILARDKLIGQLIDMARLDEAERKVKAILGQNPKDISGRFLEGRLRVARGKPEEAVPFLQEVTREEPNSIAGHHFLGVAYVQTQQFALARQEFSEAVRLAPASTDSRTALAATHLALESYDLAIEEAQNAIRLNPRNLQAGFTLGDAYLRKGDLSKSRQVYEALLKVIPNNPQIHYRIGLLSRKDRKPEEALQHFEEALQASPQAIEAISEIIDIFVSQGNLQKANDRITRELERAPNNALLHNLAGRVGMITNQDLKAEAAFKKAIELDSSLIASYMNLGELYQRTGKLDKARTEFEAALVHNPKLVAAYMLLGIIHQTKNELGKAITRYEEALKYNPRFAPAANNLAWLLAEADEPKLDVALSYAQTAREQAPDDPYIADTLGWILYKKTAYIKASRLHKEAVDKLPNDPTVQYHYGMALYRKGDKDLARKALEKSLKLHPSFPGSEEAKRTLLELQKGERPIS